MPRTRQPAGMLGTAALGAFVLSPVAALGGLFSSAFQHSPWWVVTAALALSWPTGFGARRLAASAGRLAPAARHRLARVLGRHRAAYVRRLHEYVRHRDPLGETGHGGRTVTFDEVYVDLAVEPCPDTGTAAAPRTVDETLTAGRAAVVAVLGGPGSGKSTLLRHLALTRHGGRREDLPVLVEIRAHADRILAEPATGIADVAAAAGTGRDATPPAWLAARLALGRCLVLLDGLDEVADAAERRAVETWLREQIARHPGNRYVIASRPHGAGDRLPAGTERVRIRPLDPERIDRFLRLTYLALERRGSGALGPAAAGRARRHAADVLERIAGDAALYDLAAGPLTLTMIVLVHRRRGILPGTRAALYEEMCALLPHRRAEATAATGLSRHQREALARRLARYMMDAGVRVLPLAEATEVLARSLPRMNPRADPGDVLTGLMNGLLTGVDGGGCAFVHPGLREHLTAMQLAETGDAKVLLTHVDDEEWNETTLLWAARSDATAVVDACLAAGTVRALALAFRCVAEAREVDAGTVRRLEAILAEKPEPRSPRHRLISGVLLERATRATARLDGGQRVCTRPVSAELYRRFIADERAAGRFAAFDRVGRGGEAVGMWSEEAVRFLAWANDVAAAPVLRFPTAGEARTAAGLLGPLTRRSLWVGGTTPPDLLPGPRAAHPARVRRDLMRRTLRRDLEGFPFTMTRAVMSVRDAGRVGRLADDDDESAGLEHAANAMRMAMDFVECGVAAGPGIPGWADDADPTGLFWPYSDVDVAVKARAEASALGRIERRVLREAAAVLVEHWRPEPAEDEGGRRGRIASPGRAVLAAWTVRRLDDLPEHLPVAVGALAASVRTRAGRGLGARADGILRDTAELLDGATARRFSWNDRSLACARLGLAAAVILGGPAHHGGLALGLTRSLATLAVIEQRGRGDIEPNEVILLARE